MLKKKSIYLVFAFAILIFMAVISGCTEKDQSPDNLVYSTNSDYPINNLNTTLLNESVQGVSKENTNFEDNKDSSESDAIKEKYNSESNSESLIKDTIDFTIYPVLILKPYDGPDYSKREFITKFEKTSYTVNFDINMSLLTGARASDKSLGIHIAKEPEEIQINYYRSFFEGNYSDEFFDDITKKLRHIKIANGLSEQEYLEYIITFVQQIPYDFMAENTRFPVEVLFDKMGDCDEKSLLLIGLLKSSGYDTALILFPDMGHAVSGIRIIPQGDTGFRMFKADDGRKYLFIEATAPAYIGLYPDEYEEQKAIVIPVSDTGIAYKNYNYVSYIVDSMKKIKNRIIFFENRLQDWYMEISELEEKLKDPYSHYIYQEEYDADFSRYSKLVKDYQEYYKIYQKNVEIYTYIAEHPYDVEGVRRTIFNSKVNEIEY